MVNEEREVKCFVDREVIYPLRGIAKLAVLSVRSMLPGATKALATIFVYLRLCLCSLPKDGCVDFIFCLWNWHIV